MKIFGIILNVTAVIALVVCIAIEISKSPWWEVDKGVAIMLCIIAATFVAGFAWALHEFRLMSDNKDND